MIDLMVKQNWLETSTETALEEFKSVLADVLNSFPVDRHIEARWSVSKISEGDTAQLIYDERALVALKIEDKMLHLKSNEDDIPRHDDIMYSIRYAANRLSLAVYSNLHSGARLPQDPGLSFDHSYFRRSRPLAEFFNQSDFTPRFAPEGLEVIGDGREALVIYSPYYAEHKRDGSIHILNNAMLDFVVDKDNQQTNPEFSYLVADSMADFARKYDLGLIPRSFYQSYGLSTKLVNDTQFDALHIKRKVFIDPYVWDFDDEHERKFYRNVKNGLHLMDKVRKGEALDDALKRVLREELQVADDYVSARIWGIEFDRDREGQLTPRLKLNIFIHGLAEKHRSQTHDWVSIK